MGVAHTEGCAQLAEEIADVLDGEHQPNFDFVDWNDLGEVTVHFNGAVYRMTVELLTEEDV